MNGGAPSNRTSAREVIEALGLERHPEGGWYKETWRAEAAENERASGSMIYYMLDAGDFSHWHRVDADEIWLWHAGAPLVLSLSANGIDAEALRLGPEISAEQRPQAVVPKGVWQSATSLGAWTLVSCAVSPAFEFSGFELAPPDWRPSPNGPPTSAS